MTETLSRRDVLRRSVSLGLAGGGFAALLGACGRGYPATTPPTGAPPSTPLAAIVPATLVPGADAGGDPGRPPIIFLHGNSNSSSLWLTAAWRFESNGWPRRRLVALDFPYPTARDDDTVSQPGRSGTDEQRAQLVELIERVRGETGAGQVVLIGNSRGGNAIRNALKHGGAASRVSHAILCGTPNHGAYARPGDNNEFNGDGSFLRGLNAGGEVVPGVAFLTIRSDRNDLYAQPAGTGYASPELAGATNVVIPGIDHGETATGPSAFAAMHQFLTGRPPDAEITPDPAITLNGRVTGYESGVPTNLGVAGVAITIYAIDPASGQRRGEALHTRTTGPDGAWGPFAAQPGTSYEFVVAAPGQPVRHFFRSPFPRSSPYVGLRLFPDAARPDRGLIVFTRPRGYIASGRDAHLLDGRPVPGVGSGVPTEGTFRVPIDGPERTVPASLNGETLTVRTIPGAVVYAEFHY
jgi:pimeloyl-ACP methyl ester carboxylesterase